MSVDNSADAIRFDSLNQLKSGFFETSISIWWLIFGVPVVMIGLMTVFLASNAASALALWLFVLLTPAIAVWVWMSNRRIIVRNQAALQTFAADNNMTFESGGNFLEAGTVFDRSKIGTLFEVGSSKKEANILSGRIQNLPFKLFKYSYETGSGKSRQTHAAMVFEVTLPRVLPQFVIDSQLENVLPISFAKSQKIELEGDFHKYFDLYAPDTYGVSALTLLAPDVMEVLLQNAALCDIEVVQDKLLFYWNYSGVSRKQYEQVFITGDAVIKKLGDKLTKANIFSTPAQTQIHASPDGRGARLKKSKIGVLILLVGILYIAARLLLETRWSPIGTVGVLFFWVFFVGWIVISFFRQATLKEQYLRRYKSK